MVLTPSQKHLGNVAGVLGILQGLAWSCMSLTCIIIYYLNDIVTNSPETYSQQLNLCLYKLYLDKEQSSLDTRIIRPSDFAVMMWIYFFFSVVLTTVSSDLIYTIRRNKNRQHNLLLIWGIIIGAISIIDLVFTALLLRDFINPPEGLALDVLHRTIIGIVMTLAARGFTLWLVNIFLGYFTMYYGIQIITHNKVKTALSDMSIPRAKIIQQPSSPIYSGTPVSESSMFQNTPKDYPSFINNNGNKFTY